MNALDYVPGQPGDDTPAMHPMQLEDAQAKIIEEVTSLFLLSTLMLVAKPAAAVAQPATAISTIAIAIAATAIAVATTAIALVATALAMPTTALD